MHLSDSRTTPTSEDIRKQLEQLSARSKEMKEAEYRDLARRQNVFTTLTNIGIIIQLFSAAVLLYYSYESSAFWMTTCIFGFAFLIGYLPQRASTMIQVWNRDGFGIIRLVVYQFIMSWIIACVIYGAGVGLRSFFK